MFSLIIGLHLGRHLKYIEMLNDARVASLGFFKYNVCTIRISKEKKFKIKFQVLLKFTQILPDYFWFSKRTCRLYHARLEKKLFCENAKNIIICRQKFHRVYVRQTYFKRFLEFHETVSSNRILLYFLKLVSISQSQLGYF